MPIPSNIWMQKINWANSKEQIKKCEEKVDLTTL